MLIKPEVENFAKIKVIGVGGGGGNSISSMIELQKIQGVEFVAVNTDAQALSINKAATKIQVGKEITKGLGSGADPEIGKKSAEESAEQLHEYLQGSDMVFITAGLGGGTGTGASPIIASIAKGLGALTIGVVTKPFHFEGRKKMDAAEMGIANLKDKVDALITIPNQKLLEIVEKKVSVKEAFMLADSVLGQGVQGIADLIVTPGLVNVDFADVRTIMTNAGSALMGIGIGTGENRAAMAAKQAVSSPLLEVAIDGAKGVLFNIVGGEDLTMHEVDEAARVISETVDSDANIIFGAAIDERMSDQLKITVIATGFDEAIQVLKEEVKTHKQQISKPLDEDERYEIPAFLRNR